MGRAARVLCWVLIVGVVGAPYVHAAVVRWTADPPADTIEVEIPGFDEDRSNELAVPGLFAIPIALVGGWLAIRRPEGRRLRFQRPGARAADRSLVSFTLLAVGTRLGYFLALFGVRVPAGWASSFVVPLLVLLWAWRSLGRRELEDAWGLGLGARPAREVLVALLVLAWLLLQAALFMHVALQISDAGFFWLFRGHSGLVMVVIAPVIEEVFFRGALYTALRRSEGWIGAAGVVGLLFAISHGFAPNVWFTVGHFLFGFVLCMVREWRGSLVACVVAHSLFNAVIFVPSVVRDWGWFSEFFP